MAVKLPKPETALRFNAQKRVGYTRYRKLWDSLKGNLKEPDPQLLLGIQQLINPKLPWTSRDAMKVLVDDLILENAIEKDELPLLIGHEWLHHTTQDYFERILKGR